MSFWKEIPLQNLTEGQWESLCDGCARCCLQKLENEDTGTLHYTRLACRHLDLDSCRCTDYENRLAQAPDCVQLTANSLHQFDWLPATCSYRLIKNGQELPSWHPLQSGSSETVHQAGISVRDKVISDEWVHPDEWQEHLIDWVGANTS